MKSSPDAVKSYTKKKTPRDNHSIMKTPLPHLGINKSIISMSVRTFFFIITLFSILRVEATSFEENDMVVILGNTVIERAQHYGHLEASLTLAAAKKNLKFRNLGWSGDSVFGHARSYFGPPKEGLRRLQADLDELKPNVVIVCYGAVAAFEGEKKLPEFIEGYGRLLDMIQQSVQPREIIVVSPPPAESLGAPMPDMTEHNQRLATYSKAIGELAKKRKHFFADLNTALGTGGRGLTDNRTAFHWRRLSYNRPYIRQSSRNRPTHQKTASKPSWQQAQRNYCGKEQTFLPALAPRQRNLLASFPQT